MSGADEIYALAADFGKASAKVASTLFDVYDQSGEAFADDWRSNAAATSGAHGVHYPGSIDHEMKLSFGISVEIGPNSAKKQGRMGRGFELGSRNQPAHLDGTRALGAAEARLARAADVAIGFLAP